MHLTRTFFILLALTFIATGFFSCRDDGFDSDPSLELTFSRDSLLFDTVFTTVGSATRSFKVYNNHHRRISISSIQLGKGQASYFRFNVDGRSGSVIRDVEIGANDSIYVFVEVTVDPVDQNLPLIIADSVVFNVNQNQQDVKLVAWGQDANFIRPNHEENGLNYHLIEENTTWSGELPYVVYGLVVVAPDVTLTVKEGTRVHMHNNASLIFLGGSTMKVNGTMESPVSFQGDRLESFYQDQPGQWGRIWFTATSKDHEINHAIIKNGTVGLHVDSIGSFTDPTLTIRNSIIKNMSIAGLFAQGSHVRAENTVIANCGDHTLLLALGGNYDFRHCTFANYYNLSIRQTPSVLLNNYYQDADGNVQVRDFEHIFFGNSIIYGSLQEELLFDFHPSTDPEFTFDHCLIRTQQDTFTPPFVEVIRNQDPEFHDPGAQDYRLTENSPAIGAANPNIAFEIPLDLLGQDRTESPDIGAYQYYEIEEEE